MHTRTQLVTPDQARIWLDEKNVKNRKVSESTVERYAAEMKAGRWKLNGEAVIFGASGNLLNGQHRLLACARSGASFNTLVVIGVADDTFDTLDDGNKRSLGDVLGMNGEKYPETSAAGLNFIYQYATGQIRSKQANAGNTKQTLEQLLKKQSGIRRSEIRGPVRLHGQSVERVHSRQVPYEDQL